MLALVTVDGGLSLVESGCAAAATAPVALLFAAVVELVEVAEGDGVGVETAGLGGGLVLEFELELGLVSWTLPTLLFSPVKKTVQVLSPPPTVLLAMTRSIIGNRRTFISWESLAICATVRVGGLTARRRQQIATITIRPACHGHDRFVQSDALLLAVPRGLPSI